MGLRFRRRRGERGADGDQKRFTAYFPRAFAYAYTNLGDEFAGREVVGAAFSQAFIEHGSGDDEEFRHALFSALRDLCHERKRRMPLDIGLGAIERDVVTLTFDAGLATSEVNAILGTDDAAMNLSNALRKMRDLSSPSIVPSFFRLR